MTHKLYFELDGDVLEGFMEVEDVSTENIQSICNDKDYTLEDIYDDELGTVAVVSIME